MAVRGTTPWHLLLPLLVCWAGSTVDSQTVKFTSVSTEYFEVSWERRGEWYGIDDFTVSMVTLDGTQHPCNQPFSCVSPVCRYQSLDCGLLTPCSRVNVSVSGGNYTAPELILTTAPPVFRDVTVTIESANLTISWTNPAVEEPTCLMQANIVLELNSVEIAINSSGLQGFYWQGLCKESFGQVRLWNVGGDGESEVVSQNISYQGSDVVPLMDNLTATPGCSNLTVTWVYNNVCPEATHFNIYLNYGSPSFYTKDTNTTKYMFQRLMRGTWYRVFAEVLDKDNRTVAPYSFFSTHTLGDMVESFAAEAVSSSVINTTWLPPLCYSDTKIQYSVSKDDTPLSRLHDYDRTFNTSYTWDNLDNNYRYSVCVQPPDGRDSCQNVTTLLERPNLLRVEDSPTGDLLVTWTYLFCPYQRCDIVEFNVSWGPILENSVNTSDTVYTITGYDASVEDRRVCVAAFNTESQAVSSNTCLGDPDVDPITTTPAPHTDDHTVANPGLIIGLSCAAIILLAGVVLGVVVRVRNKRRHPIIRAASRPTEVNNANVTSGRL